MEMLPLTKQEMQQKGWQQPDFICITGDSYVDHPSFGTAIISRVLESRGFKVCIISQPQTDEDYMRFGAPRLAFLANSGGIDSMVNHYTAAKKRRSDDAYTAGNKAGARPDRALVAYSRRIKKLYPNVPLIIGGLEASFRRFAHYDYWADEVRPSVLYESGADLLSFGMGEKITTEIAERLNAGEKISDMKNIKGTCFLGSVNDIEKNSVSCASFEKVAADKTAFAKAFLIQHDEQDHIHGRAVIQKHGEKYLIQNSPMPPLSRQELDEVFNLPYTRTYHPSYEALGGVKAIEEVSNSVLYNRGCFGGCNFCSIAFHQGRYVVSRSKASVINEVEKISKSPNFKGYIHDIGGPTANFNRPACEKQRTKGLCRGKKCLAPTPCPNLEVSHAEYLDVLRAARQVQGVKKVFVRSGLRFDYLNLEKDKSFLHEFVSHHVSGQLKVAPEHSSARVLRLMGKPDIAAFDKFSKNFAAATKQAGKEQYLVPYLMSSHPGSTLHDAIDLALYLKKNHLRPQQVQDFYPTPGTASTAMFYAEINPFTMQPLYVAKTAEEKAMQRALLQYFKPENHAVVRKALLKSGRKELIGYGSECLVPPAKNAKQAGAAQSAPLNKPQQRKTNERGKGRQRKNNQQAKGPQSKSKQKKRR